MASLRMENCEASGPGSSWVQGAAFAHGNGLPKELPGITRALFFFIMPSLKGGYEAPCVLQLGTCRNRDVGVSSFSLLVLRCWLCHSMCLSQSTFSAWPDYPRDPVTPLLFTHSHKEQHSLLISSLIFSSFWLFVG